MISPRDPADPGAASEVPLIGLAHGSRDPRAAVAIASLMRAAAAGRPGLRCEPAFLDLTDPDLPSVVAALAGAGHRRAVVVPLLFSSAFHATVDAPQALSETSATTGVELVPGQILGMDRPVLRALRASATAAGLSDDAEILLLAVGSSMAAANAAVGALADQWSAERRGRVSAAFATAEPRAAAVLSETRSRSTEVGVVPLFLAPGLLLDQVAADPAARGVTVAAPLGDALAGLVLQRYDEALNAG